jgi:hypothetical protein
MSNTNHGGGRKGELSGHEGWTLGAYAWRSGHLKSPLTGDAMRAVVGVDESGRYRPGIRVNDTRSADITTTFDVKPALNKDDAMSRSRDMLREKLIDHARFAAESIQKPGEIVEVRVDARALAITGASESGAAKKYGAPAKDTLNRSITLPSRSR